MYKENKLLEEQKEGNDTELNDSKKKASKAEFYIELALFLILGILVGIAAKTEAVKRLAVGFDDYKMNIYKSDYSINTMQVKLAEERAKEISKQQEAGNQAQNVQEAEALAPASESAIQGN